MKKNKHYHCPVNGWDCPYFIDRQDFDGKPDYCLCGMGFDGLNPYEECDDFMRCMEMIVAQMITQIILMK